MTTVRVSPDALADLVERFARFETTCAGQLTDLDARARALTTTWSGEAAVTCAAAHARCALDLEQMRETLARLRIALATTHANYAAAITAATRMWP